MKVEILIARDDGMWDTQVEEIPQEVVRYPVMGFDFWCSSNLRINGKYGDAVLFALYNDNPEEGEEGRW